MVSLLSVKLEGKYNFFQCIFDKKFMNQDHCGAQNSHNSNHCDSRCHQNTINIFLTLFLGGVSLAKHCFGDFTLQV